MVTDWLSIKASKNMAYHNYNERSHAHLLQCIRHCPWTLFRMLLECSITQVPLAAVEGAVTALMFKYIVQLRSDVLVKMNVLSEKAAARLQEAAA